VAGPIMKTANAYLADCPLGTTLAGAIDPLLGRAQPEGSFECATALRRSARRGRPSETSARHAPLQAGHPVRRGFSV